MSDVNMAKFLLGYFIQKIGEFSLLSVSYAIVFYIGSRTSLSYEWGMYTPGPYSVWRSLISGVGIAMSFFVFTLYPIIILPVLLIIRKFIINKYKLFIPVFSAIISIIYVQIWVLILEFNFKLFPEWAISVIMIIFIIISSFKLYPEFSGKYSI